MSWFKTCALLSAPAAAGSSTLDALRRRGVQILALVGWVALAMLLIADALLGTGAAVPLLLIGSAANLGPTWMAFHGRFDAEARTMTGAIAATIPALMVFLLRGHAWQMDAHMYFFVGMAALVVLADWRPLLLFTALAAVHHLMLEWLAPQWVFTGSGNIGRVLFHVVAVGLQFIVLSMLTIRLERLIDAQDGAVANAKGLADAADAERSRTLAAMELARTAEAQTASERQAREDSAALTAAARRQEFRALAETFERSVTSVVTAIGAAAEALEASAVRLDETIAGTDHVADEVAAGASHAAIEITHVAASICDLSASIRTIASTASRQTELTGQASSEAQRSVRTIATLEERTALIEGLVEDIRKIAGKTNLLALNATIEAARAGEAGRGFSVVAGEVKALAEDSARNSDRISQLLVGIREGVVDTSSKLRSVNSAIGEVALAAGGIAAAVGEQQATAQSVGVSTDRAVETSADIERRIASVASAAGVVSALSVEVKTSASKLAGSARELRQSTDVFVSYLHDSRHLAA